MFSNFHNNVFYFINGKRKAKFTYLVFLPSFPWLGDIMHTQEDDEQRQRKNKTIITNL